MRVVVYRRVVVHGALSGSRLLSTGLSRLRRPGQLLYDTPGVNEASPRAVPDASIAALADQLNVGDNLAVGTFFAHRLRGPLTTLDRSALHALCVRMMGLL